MTNETIGGLCWCRLPVGHAGACQMFAGERPVGLEISKSSAFDPKDARIAELRNVCAEAYQLAGAVGAPAKALENLAYASQGAPLPHQTFLPILPEDCSEISDLRKERDAAKKQFTDHTKCVDGFLCELYDIMIDPLSDGVGKVSDTCAALKAAAIRDRETVRELRKKLEATKKDTARLDWWQKHPNLDFICDAEEGEAEFVIYQTSGGVNDREWHEIGRGLNLRAAIDAARAAMSAADQEQGK